MKTLKNFIGQIVHFQTNVLNPAIAPSVQKLKDFHAQQKRRKTDGLDELLKLRSDLSKSLAQAEERLSSNTMKLAMIATAASVALLPFVVYTVSTLPIVMIVAMAFGMIGMHIADTIAINHSRDIVAEKVNVMITGIDESVPTKRYQSSFNNKAKVDERFNELVARVLPTSAEIRRRHG